MTYSLVCFMSHGLQQEVMWLFCPKQHALHICCRLHTAA